MRVDNYTVGDFNFSSENEIYTLGIDFVPIGGGSDGSCIEIPCIEIHSQSQTEVLERAIKVLKALNEKG